jgi:hypothetical protein
MGNGYRLGVSPIELRWLAAAFGIISLPLPDDPLRHKTNSQLEVLVKEVPTALEARGWIRRAGRAGWRIDRLPAAIIQWMGKAETYLAVDSQIRNSPSRRMNVFFAGEAAMSVAREGDSYSVVIYPAVELLIGELLSWIGAPSEASAPAEEPLSIPQPMEFLRIAWTDPKIMENVLKIAGVNVQSGRKIREWADWIRWAADLSEAKSSPHGMQKKGDLFLCGGEKRMWMGTPSEDPSKLVPISPATESNVHGALQTQIGRIDRTPSMSTFTSMEKEAND